MDDDQLRHLCKLGSIMTGGIRAPDWVEYIKEADDRELRDQQTALLILSDAFVELARRAGMLPTFTVPAAQEPQP